MSRARSVPEFIVANRAPWMKGTASANATNECVGKPGRCVSALSPPEFTASSIIGKTSGPMMFAESCLTVRTTERRASKDDLASREWCSYVWAEPMLSIAFAVVGGAFEQQRPVFARKTSSSDGW